MGIAPLGVYLIHILHPRPLMVHLHILSRTGIVEEVESICIHHTKVFHLPCLKLMAAILIIIIKIHIIHILHTIIECHPLLLLPHPRLLPHPHHPPIITGSIIHQITSPLLLINSNMVIPILKVPITPPIKTKTL